MRCSRAAGVRDPQLPPHHPIPSGPSQGRHAHEARSRATGALAPPFLTTPTPIRGMGQAEYTGHEAPRGTTRHNKAPQGATWLDAAQAEAAAARSWTSTCTSAPGPAPAPAHLDQHLHQRTWTSTCTSAPAPARPACGAPSWALRTRHPGPGRLPRLTRLLCGPRRPRPGGGGRARACGRCGCAEVCVCVCVCVCGADEAFIWPVAATSKGVRVLCACGEGSGGGVRVRVVCGRWWWW